MTTNQSESGRALKSEPIILAMTMFLASNMHWKLVARGCWVDVDGQVDKVPGLTVQATLRDAVYGACTSADFETAYRNVLSSMLAAPHAKPDTVGRLPMTSTREVDFSEWAHTHFRPMRLAEPDWHPHILKLWRAAQRAWEESVGITLTPPEPEEEAPTTEKKPAEAPPEPAQPKQAPTAKRPR